MLDQPHRWHVRSFPVQYEIAPCTNPHYHKDNASPVEVRCPSRIANRRCQRETSNVSASRWEDAAMVQSLLCTHHDMMKQMERNPRLNRFRGSPSRPRSHWRRIRGSPRMRFNVMQPMDIIHVNSSAAFETERMSFNATSEPKLMHASRKDTAMQTNIAFSGWPYLICVIHFLSRGGRSLAGIETEV